MPPTRWPRVVSALLIVALGAFPLLGWTQESAPPAESETAGDAEKSALQRQEEMAARYRQFDRTLQKMADYLRKTDPQKADILMRAIKKSREERVSDQMGRIVQLLESEQFGSATERQDDVLASMQALLKLLNSDGILDENRAEQERLKDLIKDLSKLIGREKDVRAKTERGEDADRLAQAQAKVAQETKDLENKIDSQDAQKNAGQPGDPKAGDPKEGEPKSGDPKEGEPKEGDPKKGEPKEGDPKEGEPKESDPKKGEPKEGDPKSGDPKEGEPKEGDPKSGDPKSGDPKSGNPKPGQKQPGQQQPGQKQPGQQQPPQQNQESQQDNRNQRTPGREEIERARQEMERAIEELKKKNHDGASKAQDEALKELIAAKEKLEEILRQLRDEERELLLLALEARFQKMLAMQKLVWQGTVDLSRIDAAAWVERHSQQSRQLARDENEIATDAQQALTLLKEEGSSVAFPEAVEQLREDMLTVARRLDENDVGELTQAIERDIIEALAEAIEALKKELEKLKEKKKSPPPKNGEPADPPLVDVLAELKMLRSLQLRINRMTKRLGRMIESPDGEQALKADILEQLQRLGVRQGRIQEATYNLATGRNK